MLLFGLPFGQARPDNSLLAFTERSELMFVDDEQSVVFRTSTNSKFSKNSREKSKE